MCVRESESESAREREREQLTKSLSSIRSTLDFRQRSLSPSKAALMNPFD